MREAPAPRVVLPTLAECRALLADEAASMTDAEVLAFRDECMTAAYAYVAVCEERAAAARKQRSGDDAPAEGA